MAKKKAERLGRVLDEILYDRDWHYRLALNRIFLLWEETVGQKIASVAVPDVIRGEVLWVSVPDSMWMQQLHLQKIPLLDAINKRLEDENRSGAGSDKKPILKDIRFQIWRETKQVQTKSQPTGNVKKRKSPEQEAEFDRLLLSVTDEELRVRMKRIWLSQK